MKHWVLAVAVLLAGSCARAPTQQAATTKATGLEAAAIAAGVIPDPNDTDITGLYARETDRVCIVPSATAYRIGIAVDYDVEQGCSAAGSATRKGDVVHIEIDRASGCSFDAAFEGDRLRLPGRLPDECRKACSSRASLAGLAVDRLSDSAAEAATLRDRRGRALCPG